MISIVLSTFNGSRTLETTLESMCRLSPPKTDLEIIIVNNGSTDHSREILERYLNRLPLKILDQPLRGKNRALNMAIDHVRGDLIVFTDDDVVPDEHWLDELYDCAETQPNASIFGGVIEPHWEQPPPKWIFQSAPLGITFALTDPQLQAGTIFPGLIWGPNMMIRRQIFDAGHRFNEKVGPNSGQYIMGSETEFNIRVASFGYKCWFCPTAKVGHIIRDFQMQKSWVISRGYRYGKNKCLQDYTQSQQQVKSLWGIIKFPKWMLRSFIENTMKGYLERILKKDAQSVAHLWEAAFYRGYIYQAQKLQSNQKNS